MFGFHPRNPFLKTHDPDRPEPGGIDGQRVDYVRWYPPDTPFHWGQGFNHAFTNIGAINGGRWINEFLPDKEYEVPPAVTWLSYAYPVASGTSGEFQAQLVGGVPRAPTGPLTAKILDAHAAAMQQIQPAPLTAVAGSWGKT